MDAKQSERWMIKCSSLALIIVALTAMLTSH